MKRFVFCLLGFLVYTNDVRADEMFSDNLLQSLYDRSDLVVDATVAESWEGGMSSGPIPSSVAQIAFLECTPRITVNRVFKGDIPDVSPFYISVMLAYSDRATKIDWIQKGERFILFLEDRPKREPKSHHAVGDDIVRFRTFDLWFWRLPSNEALEIKLSKWAENEKARTNQSR